MTIECRYEALDCRYEAWRNFMLILAGLLVVDCFARFSEIETAIISLTQFDKTFGTNLWPKLLTLMVVIYVTKNAHGIIITLFDEEYVKRIKGSITQSVLFYVFTSMVILSFLLVIHLVNVVENKQPFSGGPSY